MSGQLCLKWNNHTNAFNKILSKIYFKEIYSDATLLCENKCYPVHRLVLSTCSDYFEEIFQQCSNFNHKHPFIIIKEVHSEQLEALLNYMYKGEVNVPQEVLPELIKAAEVFQIKGLAVPDEEDDTPKPSKKRSHPSSSSPSALSKKSRKQSSRENIQNESNEPNPERHSTSEVYLTEEKPVIKSEPVEPPIEILDDDNEESQSSSLKEEEFQSYSEHEPDTNYEDFDLENSSQGPADFEPTQSTSWDNSQGFTEKPPETNASASDNMIMGEGDYRMIDPSMYPKKILRCTLCNYTTLIKYCLTRHSRVHTGEKPFSCHLCEYKATQKVNLQNHMKTHSREKAFTCTECDYKSTLKYGLISHIKNNHASSM